MTHVGSNILCHSFPAMQVSFLYQWLRGFNKINVNFIVTGIPFGDAEKAL